MAERDAEIPKVCEFSMLLKVIVIAVTNVGLLNIGQTSCL